MSLNPYDAIHQSVISSALIFPLDFDSFFNPTGMNHTGYASDGLWYDSGVVNPELIASWYSEAASSYRGSTSSFPSNALILLSRASLSIFTVGQDILSMWMIFLMGDTLGLTDNFNNATVGLTPSGVTWANGILTVSYQPDAGSPTTATIAVTVDFGKDSIYVETCM